MIELCAASLYPDPKISLGFTMCLSNDYERIPDQDLIEDCALEHGVNFDKLNHCVSRDDGYAIWLLRKSVIRSTEAGISTSCTVSGVTVVDFILDAVVLRVGLTALVGSTERRSSLRPRFRAMEGL